MALINEALNNLNVEKIDNVFEITVVTDNAVNVKNIYNHQHYTLSIQNFEKSIKTFLTDEILARRSKKQVKQIGKIMPVETQPIEKVEKTEEPSITNEPSSTTNNIPTFIKIARDPIGKVVFRKSNSKVVFYSNADPYANDPYNDLYGG